MESSFNIFRRSICSNKTTHSRKVRKMISRREKNVANYFAFFSKRKSDRHNAKIINLSICLEKNNGQIFFSFHQIVVFHDLQKWESIVVKTSVFKSSNNFKWFRVVGLRKKMEMINYYFYTNHEFFKNYWQSYTGFMQFRVDSNLDKKAI